MKKEKQVGFWDEIKDHLIVFFVIVLPMILLILLLGYIEEEYELGQYLWIFNIIVLIVTPLYYFIHNLREKNKTRKIERKTIIKNIDFDYYREIMKEYSPALLSFILDGTEPKKDLSASVVYLINKGYLELTKENKVKKTEKDSSKLPEDLQLICNNINDILNTIQNQKEELKKVNRNDIIVSYSTALKIDWGKCIEKQAREKGLVKERTKFRFNSFLTILCLLEIPYSMYLNNNLLAMFAGFLAFVLMFLKFWAYDENKWVKTQKGYEIYTKIIGLKNYIKDYSMISQAELEQINLWEDYLIYAIIFNDTSKLGKQALDFYNKLRGTSTT